MTLEIPTDDWQGSVLEVLHLVVVADLRASINFYTDALGGRLVRETPGMLGFVDVAGASLVLSVGGEPTPDKPTVRFEPPVEPDRVSAELIFRVRDVAAVAAELTSRGAAPITPPVSWPWETRFYVRDPDGHLIEFTQPPGAPS